MKFTLLPLLLAAQILSAGALTLEIGNPQASAEAKAMHALVTARVTACHEPAKSTVRANLVIEDGATVRRVPLNVVALSTPGLFAVVSNNASAGLVEITVTNPEYQHYEPGVLIRAGADGPDWASLKRFYNKQ